jgi:hypothetical protein
MLDWVFHSGSQRPSVNWHFKTPAGATAKLAGNLVDAFTGQMSSDALFQRFAYPRPAKSYPGLSTRTF